MHNDTLQNLVAVCQEALDLRQSASLLHENHSEETLEFVSKASKGLNEVWSKIPACAPQEQGDMRLRSVLVLFGLVLDELSQSKNSHLRDLADRLNQERIWLEDMAFESAGSNSHVAGKLLNPFKPIGGMLA